MRPNLCARAGTSKPGAPAASITRREDQNHRPEELEELQPFPCYERVPRGIGMQRRLGHFPLTNI